MLLVGRRSYGRVVDPVHKFRVPGHLRTDGVDFRLLQRWGIGRTPS